MRIHASSIWLLPLALFAAPVTAQTSKVIGTVSMSNGRRAPGASVNVRCGGVAATRFTDASGSFAVEDVPVGECQVIVVTTALRVVVRTVTVNGDVPAIVTVVLSPAAVNTPRSASRSAAPDRMALQVNGGGEGSSSRQLLLGDRWAAQGLFELNEKRPQAGFGPTWRTKAGISYAGPAGIQVTASVVGRRGYDLPL